MAKLGVGVGEEFPLDEAGRNPPGDRDGRHGPAWHGHGRWHVALHIAAHVAVIALAVGAFLWFMGPFHGGPFAPSGWHVPHVWVPLLVIAVLFALARRHRFHHMHHHGYRHWHGYRYDHCERD